MKTIKSSIDLKIGLFLTLVVYNYVFLANSNIKIEKEIRNVQIQIKFKPIQYRKIVCTIHFNFYDVHTTSRP